MMRGKTLVASLALVLVVCLADLAFSQSASTGQIAGRVKDTSGASVSGAKVVVKSQAGLTREANSDAGGDYAFTLLPPGAYQVKVSSPGFRTNLLQGITVRISETAVVDVVLAVGEVKESITVTAAAPLLQTETSTTGRVVDERQIRELPLATGNFTQILNLSPGTFASVPNNANPGQNSQDISVNGARQFGNNLVLNGVDANQMGLNNAENIPIPSPESLQEFKVQTSLFDASQGRTGGGLIAAVTKSGTDQLHGSLYEFFQNEKLNANDFFFNKTGSPRPVLKRNRFGGTLGGPIRRGKAYYFGSYEGSRERNGASSTSSLTSVILPPGLTDDRSLAGLSAATGGAVTPAQITPQALALLNARLPDGKLVIPSPQVAGSGTNFTASIPSLFRADQFNANVDYNFTSKNTFSAKVFFNDQATKLGFVRGFDPQNFANLPGFGLTSKQRNTFVSLTDTQVFGGNLLNEARAGMFRLGSIFVPEEPITAQQIGIQRFNTSIIPALPSIQVLGFGALGSFRIGTVPIIDVKGPITTFTFGDTISYTKGKHGIRAGGEFKDIQENISADFIQRGVILFLNFNSLLQGQPLLSFVGSGITNFGFRNKDFAAFVQDDYKLRRNLTLNLGLRYEVFGMASDRFGRLSNFDPRQYKVGPPPNGFVLAGNAIPQFRQSGLPLGSDTLLDDTDLNNFAPRIGFAYQPRAGTPLVVRGGYGIFYVRISNQAPFFMFSNPPFAQLGFGFGPLSNPFPNLPLPSQFPITPVVPGTNVNPLSALSVFAFDPGFRTPYMQQYNLNLQYEFTKDFLLEVGYVGSKGTKLLRRVNIGQSLLASPASPVNGETTNTPANALLRSRFWGFAPNGTFQFQSSGNSSYNSLQVSLTKRFSHGLQFLASYTYSRSIDDVLTIQSIGDSQVPTRGDQTKLSQNRGPSDFDRPHRFVVSYLYDLPAPVRRTSVAGKFLADWSLAGIATFQSGTPFDITDSAAGSFFGGSNLVQGLTGRPDFAPGANAGTASLSGSVTSRLNKFFNTSAFVPAPTICAGQTIRGTNFVADACGTIFGLVSRNVLRGPGQKNVDFSLIKRILLREPQQLEFRAEFFNIFNWANFANPQGDIESANFGAITETTGNPRLIQFALRYSF